MDSKFCSRCKKVLPLDMFYRDHKRKDGHSCWCSSCVKDYVLTKYRSDPTYTARVKERASRAPKRKEYSRKAKSNYAKKNRSKMNEVKRTQHYLTLQGIREKLWRRAGQKCELCGSSIRRLRGHSNYAIHHLNRNRNDNSIDNLVVVCIHCHLGKLHSPYYPTHKSF